MKIKIKRVYECPEKEDGIRILVDRLWPRGLTKAKAAVDLWLKDISPSTDLRKWFGHDPDRWTEFTSPVSRRTQEERRAVSAPEKSDGERGGNVGLWREGRRT